jgi:hypothetical protein
MGYSDSIVASIAFAALRRKLGVLDARRPLEAMNA